MSLGKPTEMDLLSVLDIPVELQERWGDGTSSILRRLLDQHSRRVVLAVARAFCATGYGAPADAHVAADVAEAALDALSSAFSAYIAWGRDPVTTIFARRTAHDGSTDPLQIACAAAEEAVALDVHDRLVSAGLRLSSKPTVEVRRA